MTPTIKPLKKAEFGSGVLPEKRENTMEVLALIPARGGSKGIRRKNLVLFKGLPLVVHSIQHAKACERITRTIVSTEDDEILRVSLEAGAEVPFARPRELAEDHVLDYPVFFHALTFLAERENYRPDVVVHLRPTTPHRNPSWIDEAVRLLMEHPDADSVRSVSKPSQHPYRMFRIGTDGYLDPIMKHEHPVPYLLRRQELPDVYYYNCVIDVTWPRTILEKNSMTGDHILPYLMHPDDVIDIDSPRDLQIAETLFGDKR
jgi:CMP-N,N'-diacetyllegionaminic acid synthase